MSKASELREVANDIYDIGEEILALVDQMESLLRVDRDIREQARAYWLSHIRSAVGGYGTMVSLQDTVAELKEEASEMEEENQEELDT